MIADVETIVGAEMEKYKQKCDAAQQRYTETKSRSAYKVMHKNQVLYNALAIYLAQKQIVNGFMDKLDGVRSICARTATKSLDEGIDNPMLTELINAIMEQLQ